MIKQFVFCAVWFGFSCVQINDKFKYKYEVCKILSVLLPIVSFMFGLVFVFPLPVFFSCLLHHQPIDIWWLWAARRTEMVAKKEISSINFVHGLSWKTSKFDCRHRRSNTAGLCAKPSETTRISSEVKYDRNGY